MLKPLLQIFNFTKKETHTALATVFFWGILIIPLISSNLFFETYFDTKWISLYFIVFLSIFINWIKKNNPNYRIKNKFRIPIFVLSVWIIFLIIKNGIFGFENQILDYLSAIFISIFSISLDRVDPEYKILKRTTQGALLLFLCMFAVQVVLLKDIRLVMVSIFGNENFASEILGLLVLFVLPGALFGKDKIKIILSFLSVVVIFFLVSYLNSRAVLVSCMLCCLMYFISLARKEKIILSLLMILLLTFNIKNIVNIYEKTVGPLNSKEYYISKNKDDQIKENNIQVRLVRWSNTLEMIKENPLGVGPNKYQFKYLSYFHKINIDPEIFELNLAKSPHNIYLELLAEYGVPGFFIIFLIVVILIKQVFINYHRLKEKSLIHLSILIFILTEGLFAFPLESAFPFYIFFGLLGSYFIEFNDKTETTEIRFSIFAISFQRLLNLLKVIWCILFIIVFTTRFVEKNYSNNISLTQFSCAINKELWQNCISYLNLEFFRMTEIDKSIKSGKLITPDKPIEQELDHLASEITSYYRFYEDNYYLDQLRINLYDYQKKCLEKSRVIEKIKLKFQKPSSNFWNTYTHNCSSFE